MKLYTEKQLLDICQSVAEKACANSLPESFIKNSCDYYGNSKMRLIGFTEQEFQNIMDDDDIEMITVKLMSYYNKKN